MINYRMTACLLTAMMAVSAMSAMADDNTPGTPLPGSLDFLDIRNVKVYTSYTVQDGQPVDWKGEGYHAGIQVFTFLCTNNKPIPKDVEIPANPESFVTVKDLNGNVVTTQTKDEKTIFKALKYTSSFKLGRSFSFGVTRGGEYKLTGGLSPDLYTYEQDLVLPDEPNAQVIGTTVSVKEKLEPIVTLSSGYPYDPKDYSKEYTLHWTVVSAKDPTKILAENTEKFELKSETETLAAIAALQLPLPDAVPGEYIYTMTSDFAPANRTFTAKVNDVIKAEINIDKTSFVFDEDKEALLSVDLKYGYPYVGLDQNTGKSNVNVATTLYTHTNDNLFSDPSWADSDLNFNKDITVSFENLTLEQVAECEGKVPLKVEVYFNNVSQYSQDFVLNFAYNTTGVDSVESDAADKEVRYYNIYGVEVDADYRGIIISSEGKKFLRK